MTLREYYSALEHHDWYYDYSDDIQVWRAGTARRNELTALAKQGGPEYEALYAGFHKHYFSGEPWNTPQAPKPPMP